MGSSLNSLLTSYRRESARAQQDVIRLGTSIANIELQIGGSKIQLARAEALLAACRDLTDPATNAETSAESVGSMVASAICDDAVRNAPALDLSESDTLISEIVDAATQIVATVSGQLSDLQTSRDALYDEYASACAAKNCADNNAYQTWLRIQRRR